MVNYNFDLNLLYFGPVLTIVLLLNAFDDLDLDLDLTLTCQKWLMVSDLDFGLDMWHDLDLDLWPLTLTCHGHYTTELSNSSYLRPTAGYAQQWVSEWV